LPVDVTTDLIGRRPDIAAARARGSRRQPHQGGARRFLSGDQAECAGRVPGAGPWQPVRQRLHLWAGRPRDQPAAVPGGALQGQYRQARATYDEAVASYDGTVATAFHEVADAVASRNALAARPGKPAALAASEQAYAIAWQRYEGGLSTYLNVLTAEQQVLQSRMAVADLEARAFSLDVALVRALGGGFSITSTAIAAPKDFSHG
jgi:outer membrane protein TolC